MRKEFSWSGVIVVLICLACMSYYYLIFRHAIESQVRHQHTVIDNTSI
jgi:hypothetical protein